MNDMTPESMARLQERWREADVEVDAVTNGSNAYSCLHMIRRSLEQMGLDLEQDATYELLEPGLSKAEFDTFYTHAQINDALHYYHRTVTVNREDYLGVYNGRRANGIKHMLDETLPRLKESLAETGVPDALSPLAKQQLEFVLRVYRDGTLENDMRRSAAMAAQDHFRTMRSCYETVQKQKPGDRNTLPAEEGLSYAYMAVKMIERAGDHYEPCDIPAEHGMSGGWDEKAGTVHFSREAVEGLRKLLLVCEQGVKPLPEKKL